VARLARALGERLGLSERRCEMLELAGLLHDLGKLRVPDELLDKPGRLTPRSTRS
jgi:HD-GYP domain-containing protein (c-di-GMP phosphodiesterase class II)